MRRSNVTVSILPCTRTRISGFPITPDIVVDRRENDSVAVSHQTFELFVGTVGYPGWTANPPPTRTDTDAAKHSRGPRACPLDSYCFSIQQAHRHSRICGSGNRSDLSRLQHIRISAQYDQATRASAAIFRLKIVILAIDEDYGKEQLEENPIGLASLLARFPAAQFLAPIFVISEYLVRIFALLSRHALFGT